MILLTVMGIAIIIASRRTDQESIEIEKLNDKFDTLRDALESEVLSKHELKALKKQRKKQEKEEEKALKKKSKEGKEPEKPKLFVLRFMGDMHASEVDNLREAVTAVLLVAKSSLDKVLVILDSSGGYVHNYGLAASQLKRLRDSHIHLTVSVDLVAASGGYLMACIANRIIAAPFAVIGSIGVLAQIPNFNRLLEKYDVDIEQHTAGEYKTTLTLLGKNTDKARKKFKEELEDTHILFKQFVSEHRPILDINKLATGEHWYGSKALELKLIDEIITSDDYILNKNETHDIFEVSYVINETLKDKISHIFESASKGFLKSITKFFVKPTVP